MNDISYDDLVQQLNSAQHHPGLSQLICFAVTDNEFAAELLKNPADALHRLPEGVVLTDSDRELLLSLPPQMSDIQELAAMLWRNMAQPQHPPVNGHSIEPNCAAIQGA
ncbi:MAG: hypothetical protein OHK0022_20540 [Roseiflexaceae bacterium]